MSSDASYDSPAYISLKPGYVSSLANAARQFKAFWASLLLVAVVYSAIIYLMQLPIYLPMFSPDYTSHIPRSSTSPVPENFWWFVFYG